jgi:hypothetical protein
MVMANINVGDKVELPGVNGAFEVKSVSRLTRGNLQTVLEKDKSRICITRNQATFKKVKTQLKKLDKFSEILAEL